MKTFEEHQNQANMTVCDWLEGQEGFCIKIAFVCFC